MLTQFTHWSRSTEDTWNQSNTQQAFETESNADREKRRFRVPCMLLPKLTRSIDANSRCESTPINEVDKFVRSRLV